MPKRKSGKHQKAKRKRRTKEHKPAVAKTLENNEESSPSHSKVHEVAQNPSVTEYSTNWKALAKQLGLETTRKDHTDEDRDSTDHQRIRTGSRSNDSKRGGHRRHNDPFSKHFKGPPSSKTTDSKSRKRERTTADDIWFDDVPLELVEGEPVAKKSKTTSLVTGSDKIAGKCVSLDCEMVGTGPGGEFSMLARCSIVNHHGNVLYDSYVAPMDRVTDYRTRFSGIRPRDLVGAPDFKTVQKSVSDIITGRKLVGHGIQNDLKVLLLSHPKRDIRDTSKYKPFRTISNGGTPGLRKLAMEILKLEIHDKEHDSIEDAQIAMRLYQMSKRKWECSLKTRLKKPIT